MSLEDLPSWIYTLFVAPLGFAVYRIFDHFNRIATLESKMEKLDKLDSLCDDVQYIKGLLDERFRK